METVTYFVGEDVTIEELFTGVNSDKKNRIEKFGSDKIFIPGFVSFQYGTLSLACRPHLPIIKLIEKHGLSDRLEDFIENYSSTTGAIRKRLTKSLREEIYKSDDYQCQYCGVRPGIDLLTIDHIKPIVNGGENDVNNLTTSCITCNSKKWDKDVFEFLSINKINPLNNLIKKLNTLSNKLDTLEEKERDKEKETYKEQEEDFGKSENLLTTEPQKELQEKHVVPEMMKEWLHVLPDYPQKIEKDYPALREIADFICKEFRIDFDVGKITAEFKKIAVFVSRDGFKKNYALYQVNNSMQQILQQMREAEKKQLQQQDELSDFQKELLKKREAAKGLKANYG